MMITTTWRTSHIEAATPFLHMLLIYLFWFQKVLTDSLTHISSAFIDIWRYAVGAKDGLKIKQNTVFWPRIWKTSFKSLLLLHCLTFLLDNLHNGASQKYKKLEMGVNFLILHFCTIQNTKTCKRGDFAIFGTSKCYK